MPNINKYLLPAIWALLCYFLGSLLELSTNPVMWSVALRAVALFSIFLGCVTASLDKWSLVDVIYFAIFIACVSSGVYVVLIIVMMDPNPITWPDGARVAYSCAVITISWTGLNQDMSRRM